MSVLWYLCRFFPGTLSTQSIHRSAAACPAAAPSLSLSLCLSSSGLDSRFRCEPTSPSFFLPLRPLSLLSLRALNNFQTRRTPASVHDSRVVDPRFFWSGTRGKRHRNRSRNSTSTQHRQSGHCHCHCCCNSVSPSSVACPPSLSSVGVSTAVVTVIVANNQLSNQQQLVCALGLLCSALTC